ncbi:MAG TPA: SDR family oxidoreductase [Sphingomonadaceae bacterium]|nr:SDR family oxidoreductase [Sphingomonadaceae bacterium]
MTEPRTAIVTGGGAGIGRACVARFAALGYRVLVADRDGAAAEAAAALVPDAAALACDVADPAACDALAAHGLERWGRIDVLVANAGVQIGGRLIDTSPADWERLIAVNLKGVADCCRAVLPAMIARRSGSIVLVSSSNATRAPRGMAVYDITKAGVLGLMRNLAVDHGGDGIRVNAVCPGATLTDHHLRAAAARGVSEADLRAQTAGYGLLGRVGEPSEIAAAIAFLAGDDASFVTGATLAVDGGFAIQG